jgi:predicted  nucleic acid-binding Zn-ribbon protein
VANENNGWTAGRVAAAAAVAAGLLLTGCDASNDTAAAQKAQREAAGRMISAGEPHPTERLVNEAATADTEALGKQLEALAAKGAGLSDYLTQKTPADDLDGAIKLLQDALKLAPAPPAKANLQIQLAQAQLQLSDARAAGVQPELLNLNEQAEGILSLAQEVINLNSAAAALQKAAQPPSSAALDKAKAALTDRQKALADLQGKVRDLQAQIAAKESDARQVYAATDAAFTAADALKGQASIAAAQKAMDDRKRAEDLMAQSGDLAPALTEAQARQALGKIALDEAQRQADLAAAAYDQAVKASAAAADRMKNLRASAAAILAGSGDDPGLDARVAKFFELAAKVEPQVRAALSVADSAAGNFSAAGISYGAYLSDLQRRAEENQWKSADPLRSVVKDPRMTALITWCKSAAEQQAGRLALTAAQSFGLAANVAAKTGQANVKATPKFSPGDWRKSFNDLAVASFAKAAASAHEGNGRTGAELNNIRWIGLSLEAAALQGSYQAGNRNALAEATKLRNDAGNANPGIRDQLSWIGQ